MLARKETNWMGHRKNLVVVGLLILLTLILPLTSVGIAYEWTREDWAAESEEVPKYGGVLRMGIEANPSTLNPILTNSIKDQFVSSKIYQGLLEHDMNSNPVPELAESWAISEDGLTYTFHLVRNATWHDGVPFTSADVKYSFEEGHMKYNPMTEWKNIIASVEAPDNYTAVFTLNYVFPGLHFYLAFKYGAILPKHLYEGTDFLNNTHNFDNPIGTGPFKWGEWVHGSHITLVRNENYFKGGKPYLDGIIMTIIPDAMTRALALKTGEIDYVPMYYPAPEVPAIKEDPRFNFFDFNIMGGGIVFIGFNLRHPILSDLRVRQAICHAIDKTFIGETAAYGLGFEAKGPIHPVGWGANPDLQPPEYDPAEANRLLDEAGYPRGAGGVRFTLRLATDSGFFMKLKTSEIVVGYLKEVGIQVDLRGMDLSTLFEIVYDQWDFDLVCDSYVSGPDPVVAVQRMFHSDMILNMPNRCNAWDYNNSRVDELIDVAAREINDTERLGDLYEFQDIMVEDLPMDWVWTSG